jgi:hypothetical protein
MAEVHYRTGQSRWDRSRLVVTDDLLATTWSIFAPIPSARAAARLPQGALLRPVASRSTPPGYGRCRNPGRHPRSTHHRSPSPLEPPSADATPLAEPLICPLRRQGRLIFIRTLSSRQALAP